MALGAWVRVSLSSVTPVTLSFVGADRSTAVVGGLRGCWAVGVVRWVLAVVCRSLSALRVVVDWAVVVCWAAGFVCGGGCVTWQRATWRAHSVSLTLGRGPVVVVFGCQAVVVVCGRPGMFVVVGVACR